MFAYIREGRDPNCPQKITFSPMLMVGSPLCQRQFCHAQAVTEQKYHYQTFDISEYYMFHAVASSVCNNLDRAPMTVHMFAQLVPKGMNIFGYSQVA